MRTWCHQLHVFVALIGAAVFSIAAKPSDVTHFPHPRVQALVKFPGARVPDSRLAIILATETYLATLNQPIAIGPPLPSEALSDLTDFAKKGDKLWEVAIFSYTATSRRQIGIINVNAKTGRSMVLCLEPKQPCAAVGN